MKNTPLVFKRLYGSDKKPVRCKYSVGDRVRIPLKKSLFDKGYSPSWSEELYTISKVHNDRSVCYYSLIDQDGQELERKFYSEEINLVLKHA